MTRTLPREPIQVAVDAANRNIRNLLVGATKDQMDNMYTQAVACDDLAQIKVLNTIFQECEAAGVDTYGEIPIGYVPPAGWELKPVVNRNIRDRVG